MPGRIPFPLRLLTTGLPRCSAIFRTKGAPSDAPAPTPEQRPFRIREQPGRVRQLAGNRPPAGEYGRRFHQEDLLLGP